MTLLEGAAPVARQVLVQAASRFKQIRRSTVKVAGFETASGRQLAVIKEAKGRPTIFIEPVAGRPMLGRVDPYVPERPRNSNLDAQAPRLRNGKAAVKWILEPSEVPAALDWYAKV